MKEQMTKAVMNAEAEEAVLDNVCLVESEEEKAGFWKDNRGVGVVEVILILVVLIALVLIFKEQLSSMVTKAMEALEKTMNEVLS